MTQPPFNPLDPSAPSSPEPQTPPQVPSQAPVYGSAPANPPQEPPIPPVPQTPPAPEQPQAPQQPQAPYPQQPYAPQPQYAAAPVAPAYVAQAPAPKKKRTGLIVAIVIVAVALVATGGYFGFRQAVGNRLTPYCRAAADVNSQIEDLNNELATASSDADLDEMSQVMGELIDVFDQLRSASPPDTVAPALDTVYDYLTHLKGFIDTGDMMGYLNYINEHDPTELLNAATTVETASNQYCS